MVSGWQEELPIGHEELLNDLVAEGVSSWWNRSIGSVPSSGWGESVENAYTSERP